jgi:hypothetical protein
MNSCSSQPRIIWIIAHGVGSTPPVPGSSQFSGKLITHGDHLPWNCSISTTKSCFLNASCHVASGAPGGRPNSAYAGLQHAECVLVEPEQDVEAVLLDARVLAAARGALAAEPPPHLIDGDLVLVLPAWRVGDLERAREGGHPATQDRDPLLGHPIESS